MTESRTNQTMADDQQYREAIAWLERQYELAKEKHRALVEIEIQKIHKLALSWNWRGPTREHMATDFQRSHVMHIGAILKQVRAERT